MFKVINGGLSNETLFLNPEFIDGYVTDTRFMGVISLFARWSVIFEGKEQDLFQFFRFDCEEYGLEAYDYFILPKSLSPTDSEEISSKIKEFEDEHIDVLGGNRNPVSEREFRHLVQNFINYNREHGIQLPIQTKSYDFILCSEIQMSDEEEKVLMVKMCTPMLNEYQVINYFIMRVIGKDFNGAKLLTKHPIRMDVFNEHKAATLLRNSIDEEKLPFENSNSSYYPKDENLDFSTFTTRKSYICNSLITYHEKYFVLISQIVLEGLKVVKFKKISSTKISEMESSIIQREGEFVSYYELKDFEYDENDESFKEEFQHLYNFIEEVLAEPNKYFEMLNPYVMHYHETGRLYMVFNTDNRHVMEKVYRISNDVAFNFIVTELGDIVISSNSMEKLENINKNFSNSIIGSYFKLGGNFEFLTSVIGLFLDSEIYDFADFIDFISIESED